MPAWLSNSCTVRMSLMGRTNSVQRPVTFALFDVTQLIRRWLAGNGRMLHIRFARGTFPVLPIDIFARRGLQQAAVMYLERGDMLQELLPGKPISAPVRLRLPLTSTPERSLDLAAVLRLNEPFDMPYVPVSPLLGYVVLAQKFQAVILDLETGSENARGVSDMDGTYLSRMQGGLAYFA